MSKTYPTSEITSLLDFLDTSPTAWHAVENVETLLQKNGFKKLEEIDAWSLQSGARYYVTRNGSSLCAFIIPEDSVEDVCLVASHTDSPTFKLKQNAEFRKENMLMLGVEVYGSPLITSWLNRDLGIAGRISFRNAQDKIQEANVCLSEHPVIIPQLAIHIDRAVNEKGLLLNPQDHLAAIAAIDLTEQHMNGSYLESLLKEKVPYKKLLATDLFLYPLEPAKLIGFQQQLISSYRIDSLCSVHAIALALAQAKAAKNTLKMAIVWDNEEIGSATAQGANSPFFLQVLERVTLSQNQKREDFLRMINRSLCVSVDLAHALHPNYAEKHEPRHPVLMNHGVVLKTHAQQRYATDAHSAARIVDLCDRHQIPLQKMAARGDIPCGTTIGPIHAHSTGMPTVDIGTAQLSMHSCRELTACKDHLYMCHLLNEVLR